MPAEFGEEDQKLKEQLLSQGFAKWNKRDFFKFINMCEIFGRENIEYYQDLLQSGKTYE